MFQKPTDPTPKPAVLPIEPSRAALVRNRFLLGVVGPLARLGMKKQVRGIQVRGRENLAGPGPKLVLMNHSNPLDPLLFTFYSGHMIHFLITEPYMTRRLFSRVASFVGQITKRKLDTDTRAIRTMKQWCALGASVAMFPEGQFSWDGKPLPLQPGLDQLIRYLDVPVVIVRLINGDRLWPAWAKHPRRTELRLEIDPPIRFGAEFSAPGAIEAEVARRLYVDPDHCERFPAVGERLAEGMAQFLRFCFSCGADRVGSRGFGSVSGVGSVSDRSAGKGTDQGPSHGVGTASGVGSVSALTDQGDVLSCRACGGTWAVDTENELTPKILGAGATGATGATDVGSRGAKISVATAWTKVREGLKSKWTGGVNLDSLGVVTVFDATQQQWVRVDEGKLFLRGSDTRHGSDTVTGTPGDTVRAAGIRHGSDITVNVNGWTLPLKDILAHTMDWGDLILLRTQRKRFALRMRDDSRAVWTFALDQALAAHGPAVGAVK